MVGVYSDKDIRELIKKGVIQGNINDEQIQPSSLDLTLGSYVYCLPFSSILSASDSFEDYLERYSAYKLNLDEKPLFLHKGVLYIIELQERVSLPEGILALSNPKSSTGRTDIHVRLITEPNQGKKQLFDIIPENYSGKLWLEVYSNSFDIMVYKGLSLNQIRFYDKATKQVEKQELIKVNNDKGVLFNDKGVAEPHFFGDSVLLSLHLPKDGVVGYIAKKSPYPVDLSKKENKIDYFFEELRNQNNGIIIEKDSFYILVSKEIVKIPENLCAELEPFDSFTGEYRVHYAGFIDPGFEGRIVLEIRNFGPRFLLRDNQVIGRLKFFKLKQPPYNKYGVNSNYQQQKGPRLAKFFS